MLNFKRFDWYLFIIWFVLICCGVIAIYTASTSKIGEELHSKNYYIKQLLWIGITLIANIILLKIPYRIFDLFIIPLYGVTLVLLGLVLLAPAINGSHRWLNLGFSNIQPSEFAKIFTILFVAKIITKPHLSEYSILLRSMIGILPPILLILFEPDLGTTLVFWFATFFMLAVAGLPYFYLSVIISPIFSVVTAFHYPFFIIFILLLILYLYKSKLSVIVISLISIANIFVFFLTPVLWNSMKPYQQGRILTFIDPSRDPLGAGYQIIQAKIAIGSGGLFGKGFLQGSQKNLDFLPEKHTDFIFSVIGEEFGFIGIVVLILLFLFLLFRIIRSIEIMKTLEHKVAATGILAYLTFQIFINIGMNIGLVPTTGIPLPFISYGGSSLLINSLSVGMILKYLTREIL